MNRLIFCDIDGTIVDGSRGMYKVSNKTKYAIDELSKEDYVIIASGRCKGLLDKDILDLNASGYILCNGGYCELKGNKIYSDSFSLEAVNKIKEVSINNNGFYILESLNKMYIDSLNSEPFQLFAQAWGKGLKGFELGDDPDNNYHIAMIGFMNEESMSIAKDELSDYVDLARHNKSYSYDVNIKGITKATGVKALIDYLNTPLKDTYCFGDGINDLEMLKEVGHPIIMANANPKLKGYGFEETDDVLDDGLYNYLINNELIKAL